MTFIDFLWENKIRLVVAIFVIFFVIYTFFDAIGFVPESFQAEPASSLVATLATTSTALVATPVPVSTTTVLSTKIVKPTTTIITKKKGEDPVRVVIPKIGVDTHVSNPLSTKESVLDEYLLRGAVRYPGSAGLGAGNVFMFGHSTGFRVVNNQAYKAFNHFKLLVPGDTIQVYSLDKVYTYGVERVRLADAADVYVDLSTPKNMITLSTCNVFGEKQERYIVEATFKSVRNLDEEVI